MFILEVSKAYLKLKRIYLMLISVCSVSCKTFNLQKILIKLAFSHKQISFPSQESCYSKWANFTSIEYFLTRRKSLWVLDSCYCDK